MTAMPAPPHHDIHYVQRSGWLRAAVLGANDGIVSTASLLVGVAASSAGHGAVLLSGSAALIAGALSMAAGEYVSVSAQADIERADLAKEKRAIAKQPDVELAELRDIYVERGLDPALAAQVAEQLMVADSLGAHARDELGITDTGAARPLQAALASAASFASGAALPLAVAVLATRDSLVPVIAESTLLCLVLLGYLSARAGGGTPGRAILRIVIWSAVAMGATALVGHLFGASV